MRSFPIYQQLNSMDCGPTCVRMVAKYYGKHFNAAGIRNVAGYNKEGVNLLGISQAAETIGFRTRGIQLTYQELTKEVSLPCILHWNQNHFVVLTEKRKPLFTYTEKLIIADPARGLLSYTRDEFLNSWISAEDEEEGKIGTALLLEPTAKFYEQQDEKIDKMRWGTVFRYLRNSKRQLTQVFIALLIASFLQLLVPFLTQSVVDAGINTQNLQFITIVLIAQLMLVISQNIVDFIRTRLLLDISILLNFSLLSDFWIKLTRLPVSYFDSHQTGDTLQRISDTQRIESFLTGNAISTFFSVFNFAIFSAILMWYNFQLFFVFAIGSMCYFLWIGFFLRFRRKISYQSFHLQAKENNTVLQFLQGMQEIKLHGAEQLKRWEWENIQARIFKLNRKTLTYNQVQQSGALLINQGKNIVTTFLVANLVVEGRLTLGAMLAIQYIIGQLNSPVEQFIGFIQTGQDAKIGLERVNEVHQLPDEEPFDKNDLPEIQTLHENKTISLKSFSFAYPGGGNDPVLDDIDLEIPEGKTTAIVGTSGSGKTTLLKILLKFYEHYKGEIKVGEANLSHISPSFWRKQCGAVLQDGYIFSDTIARNIAMGQQNIDYERLLHACRTANILSYIETLPNGFSSRLGTEGTGISQGQKQRLLIARAVYRNPHYLFFDEATNALDANNEKVIVENLQEFFIGKTVLVVAHRLSTVKNADKIVVLHEGKIVEEGTHKELCLLKGKYFELVKNQLELGV